MPQARRFQTTRSLLKNTKAFALLLATPACPDHSAKQAMFDLLQCQDIGMGLTESLAMTPAASVSGFYLAHPEAQYFSVGKVADDQLQDLAARSRVQVKDLQRLLAPNL